MLSHFDLKVPQGSNIAIVGETELDQNTVTLKNMTTGEQQLLTRDQLIAALK